MLLADLKCQTAQKTGACAKACSLYRAGGECNLAAFFGFDEIFLRLWKFFKVCR
jgi:hypothetical protein